jgi:hypothetical protein
MLKDIYRTYFRKAGPFLYPTLNLPINKNFPSSGVYTALDDEIKKEDRKLIYTFDPNKEGYRQYMNRVHKTNSNFIEEIQISHDLTALIFDCSAATETWDAYLNAKYSQFRDQDKKLILKYFSYNKANLLYLTSFLYPERYFEQYAKILDVDLELLKGVGELCDKPNFEEEHLKSNVTHALVA